MTPKLRRSHRISWIVLAVLLPIGLVVALLLPRAGIPLKTGSASTIHSPIFSPAQP